MSEEDIIIRLRDCLRLPMEAQMRMHEAADEIERLRKQNQELLKTLLHPDVQDVLT